MTVKSSLLYLFSRSFDDLDEIVDRIYAFSYYSVYMDNVLDEVDEIDIAVNECQINLLGDKYL